MATTLHLTADARPECIRPIRNVVASLARDTGLPDAEVYAVKICVDEAVTNAVKHAYPEGGSGPVEVSVRDVGDELEIVVADHGGARRWRRSGKGTGFGLAFVSRLSNRCTFTARSGGTTVEMVFPRRRGRWHVRPLLTRPTAPGR